MSLLRIVSLARRIMTQIVRDKRTLGLIIIVPSIVMALLGYFYTTNSNSVIALGVANDDAGLGSLNLASDVVDALGQQGNLTIVYVKAADVNQSLKDKKIDGAIIFGPDFTKDAVLNSTVNAQIITEGTDQGKSASVSMKAHNATVSALTSTMQGLGSFSVNLGVPALPVGANTTNASLRVGIQNNDEGLDGIMLSDSVIDHLVKESGLTIVALDGGDVNQSLKDKHLSAAVVFGPEFTSDIYGSHAVNLSIVAATPDPRNMSTYQAANSAPPPAESG